MEAIVLIVVALVAVSYTLRTRFENFEPNPYTQGTPIDEGYHGKTSLLRLNNVSPFWRFYEGENSFVTSPKHITYPKNYTYRIRSQNHPHVHLGGCQHHIYNTP